MTVSDKYVLAVEEIEKILGKYEITEEDKKAILNEIRSVYFELNQAYTIGRAMETFFKKVEGHEIVEHPNWASIFSEIMMTEEVKFPFTGE